MGVVLVVVLRWRRIGGGKRRVVAASVVVARVAVVVFEGLLMVMEVSLVFAFVAERVERRHFFSSFSLSVDRDVFGSARGIEKSVAVVSLSLFSNKEI